jgi:hypothetical protein
MASFTSPRVLHVPTVLRLPPAAMNAATVCPSCSRRCSVRSCPPVPSRKGFFLPLQTITASSGAGFALLAVFGAALGLPVVFCDSLLRGGFLGRSSLLTRAAGFLWDGLLLRWGFHVRLRRLDRGRRFYHAATAAVKRKGDQREVALPTFLTAVRSVSSPPGRRRCPACEL